MANIPPIDPNNSLYPVLTVQGLPQTDAPSDLTRPIINDPFAEQNINVNEFFNDNKFYLIDQVSETNLIDSFEDAIANLPKDLTKNAFYPYINKESVNLPIHQGLSQIAENFMGIYNEAAPSVCEQFINQFMCRLYFYHGNNISVSQQPFFACFEIALRVHLFNKIAAQAKSEIDFILKANGGKFPDNLEERENALVALITKNGFFKNPWPNFFFIELESYIQSCISKNPTVDSAEQLIQSALIEFNLVKPSRSSQAFNYYLREALGNKFLSEQAIIFKDQFIKTGTISQDDFNAVSVKIYNIYSENGKFQCDTPVKGQLLAGTFNLNNERFPFQTLRNQFEAEKAAQALLPERGFFSFLQSGPKRSSEICQKLNKKLETIAWAEQEWNSLFPPVQQLIEFPVLEIPEDLAQFLSTNVPVAPNFEDSSSSSDEEIVPVTPAVKSVRAPQPLPIEAPVSNAPIVAPAPQMPEAPRIYSTSFNIPLISYINIAFANCLQAAGDDLSVWNSLPPLTRIDALRHCYFLSNYRGKAEEIAARLFKTVTEINRQLKLLENSALLQTKTHLSHAFVQKGEALLQLYYSSNRDKFFTELQSLPHETLFFQYVYEMAKEAGVHIEPWDYHFAENNWNKVTMMNLAVQALERCLHTDS